MVYKLEDALRKNVITSEDLLKQAQMDSKYGIVQEGYYHDGGSREYRYSEYTIIKLNTLEGEKDLVIGYKDSMLKDYNKVK